MQLDALRLLELVVLPETLLLTLLVVLLLVLLEVPAVLEEVVRLEVLFVLRLSIVISPPDTHSICRFFCNIREENFL